MSGMVADDPEYWVLRVCSIDCCPISQMSQGLAHDESCRTHAHVVAGDLAYVNGELVEPIEVYTTEADAKRRAMQEAARTGHVYKVSLVLEV